MVRAAAMRWAAARAFRPLAVLLLLGSACHGSGSSGSDSGSCAAGATDPFAAGAAAERALVERGRTDADFVHAFGSASGALIDAGDASMAALFGHAMTEEGLTPPTASTPTCGAAPIATRSSALLKAAWSAFAFVTLALPVQVDLAPASMDRHGSTNDTQPGSAGDGSPTPTVTTLDWVLGGHDSTVQVSVTATTSITGASTFTSESAAVVTSVDVCPDMGGVAHGTYRLVVDGAVGSGADVKVSYHGEVKDTFDLQVDESAHVTSVVTTSALAYRVMGARSEGFAVHTDAAGRTVVDENDNTSSDYRQLIGELGTFGPLTAGLVKSHAESKWRDGTCVGVQAEPESATVDPGASVSITAQPYLKFGMAKLDKPVVATLASGAGSVSPVNQPVPAPAPFTYVAGAKCKDKGVVKMTSTSNRGIGTATTTITVRPPETMMCPAGQSWNADTCKCACMPGTCTADQTWNVDTCRCECMPGTCTGARWMGTVSWVVTGDSQYTDDKDPSHPQKTFHCSGDGMIAFTGPTDAPATVDRLTMSYAESDAIDETIVDNNPVCSIKQVLHGATSLSGMSTDATRAFVNIIPAGDQMEVDVLVASGVTTGTTTTTVTTSASSPVPDPMCKGGTDEEVHDASGLLPGVNFMLTGPTSMSGGHPTFTGTKRIDVPDDRPQHYDVSWSLSAQ
jgi:hypothetical protein